MTPFSIARFYGGIKYNGESFTYLPDTDELIRDDALRWRVKQLKGEAQNESSSPIRAGQDVERKGNDE